MTEPQEPHPDKTQILGPEALRAAQAAVPAPPEGEATVMLPIGLPMLEPLPPPGEEPTQALPLVPADPEAEVRTILGGPDATVRLPAGPPPRPEDPAATRMLPVGDPALPIATQVLPVGAPPVPVGSEAQALHPDVRTMAIPPDQLPAPEKRKGLPVWAWAGLSALVLLLVLGAVGFLRPDLLGLGDESRPSESAATEPNSEPAALPARTAEAPAAEVPPALRSYLEKAEKGDAAAMRMLGVMYYNGLNVARNEQEGLKWYRKAAEAGSGAAAKELKLLEGKSSGK